jgi:hypothetical protein
MYSYVMEDIHHQMREISLPLSSRCRRGDTRVADGLIADVATVQGSADRGAAL